MKIEAIGEKRPCQDCQDHVGEFGSHTQPGGFAGSSCEKVGKVQFLKATRTKFTSLEIQILPLASLQIISNFSKLVVQFSKFGDNVLFIPTRCIAHSLCTFGKFGEKVGNKFRFLQTL